MFGMALSIWLPSSTTRFGGLFVLKIYGLRRNDKKICHRKNYEFFCVKTGLESNSTKPQIWPACIWQRPRCVCGCGCGLHEGIHTCECSLNAQITASQLAALSPPTSQILSSVLPLCLPSLAPTRSLYFSRYVWKHTCRTFEMSYHLPAYLEYRYNYLYIPLACYRSVTLWWLWLMSLIPAPCCRSDSCLAPQADIHIRRSILRMSGNIATSDWAAMSSWSHMLTEWKC